VKTLGRVVNGFCVVVTVILALPILALAFVIWLGTQLVRADWR
jgi:hypothetical protein